MAEYPGKPISGQLQARGEPQRQGRPPFLPSYFRYALFDFGLSALFPLGASNEGPECRLPVTTAGVGSPWNHPPDADADVAKDNDNDGRTYDPFKLDIACMVT